MLSLFDYLGKPAGTKLGDKVYKAAKKTNTPVTTREVHTKTYSGKVMLYPKEFLDGFFNKKTDDLPF
jgi:hypothetical protein